MNATSSESSQTHSQNPAHSVVDAVFDVGEAWAAYGLKVSRLALLTSARTLRHAAHALDVLSKGFEKRDVDVVGVEAVEE